jgi:hypothetical protein
MRRRELGFLVGFALTACHVDAAPRVAASKAPTASPTATAKPATTAPLVANLLAKPAGQATRTLTGTIAVDPAYIVAQGAGNVVAQGGGNLLAAGALVSNDGGSLINNGGSTLINNGGSTLINNGGSTLINNGGSTIVAQGAGNVVAQGAGNLSAGAGVLATDGVTIVAQGAASRRVLADAPAGPLPAAGMAVGAYSLSTGQYVPLGVDAKGQPVYTVFSNLKGAYEVYVPEAAGNVLIVANVPGQRDHRMAFNLLDGAGPRIDEDTAMVTKLLRQLMYGRFQIYIAQANNAKPTEANTDLDRAFLAATGDFVPRLRELGKTLAQGDRARRDRVVQRMADLVLPDAQGLAGLEQPVDTVKQVITQVRQQAPGYYATAKLAALLDAVRGETEAFNQTLLATQAGVAEPYTVPFGFEVKSFATPQDLPDFMVRQLYNATATGLPALKDQLLQDVGVTADQLAALHQAELALMVAAGQPLLDEQGRAKVFAAAEAP